MLRELFLHLIFLLVFFVLVSVVRGWVGLLYWPFWLGGVIGTFLPDVDHLIYVYFLRPHELTPQRTNQMIGERRFGEAVRFLAETKGERETLVFHTILFQVIFLVLTFLVVTSSGSPFGIGLVLAFSLHFLVDQWLDLRAGTWRRWFHQFSINFDQDQFRVYWWVVLVVILILGVLL